MKHVFALSVALLTTVACGGGREPCVVTDDCFRGEVCAADGFCALPSDPSDAARDDQATEGDVGSDPEDASRGPDANSSSESDATVRPGPDSGGGADGGDDAAQGNGDASLPACYADPFDTCADPENSNNNSFPGETVSPMTRGCQSSGFVPMDITIDGVMCPLDPMDMYGFNFVECDADEPGFVIEAILDVKDDCDPSLIRFDFSGVASGGCESTDSRVRCQTLPDGRRSIQILMPGDSNPVVGGIRFVVETPDRMDLRYDYSLQLIVRQ